MIDLTKLTPAPWVDSHSDLCFHPKHGGTASVPIDANHRKFIALARNAFDVMMRRGWGMHQYETEWVILPDEDNELPFEAWLQRQEFPDPFTALVEADAWYRENIEAK